MKVKGLLSDLSHILSHFKVVPDKNVNSFAVVKIITDLAAVTTKHLTYVGIPEIIFATNVVLNQGLSP